MCVRKSDRSVCEKEVRVCDDVRENECMLMTQNQCDQVWRHFKNSLENCWSLFTIWLSFVPTLEKLTMTLGIFLLL